MNELILLMQLAEIIVPRIDEAMKKGELTAEQQDEARAKYLAFRALGDAAFTGPEWETDEQA